MLVLWEMLQFITPSSGLSLLLTGLSPSPCLGFACILQKEKEKEKVDSKIYKGFKIKTNHYLYLKIFCKQ